MPEAARYSTETYCPTQSPGGAGGTMNDHETSVSKISRGTVSGDTAPDNRSLDAYRAIGDPVLDPLITSYSAARIGEMLGSLFQQDSLPLDDERFRPLLESLPPVISNDPRALERGQRLFQLYGPEVLLILGCYGLPASYAAANGVQVLFRARRLADDTQRRLCETAQMLINVMQPGALLDGGIGLRSTLKVRLMHALIRRHVELMQHLDPWLDDWGKPINQEDLAGTLLTFSALVLDGLLRIGAPLSEAEQQGYLDTWCHLGRLLGIDERLLPVSLPYARDLAARIARRQFRYSDEGRILVRDLIRVTNGLFPVPGYGLSLMHYFLDQSVFGMSLAEILDLPKPNWTRYLVRARAAQKKLYFRLLAAVPGARKRRSRMAGKFVQALILLERPDKQSPFEVPDELRSAWGLLS
ncbi:MAG TPA: oxygenase MpaB family protein [Polyangiaceae bacterium]|nr:oxygenase MpaB family protein [Polyangiaceae bacterium]